MMPSRDWSGKGRCKDKNDSVCGVGDGDFEWQQVIIDGLKARIETLEGSE